MIPTTICQYVIKILNLNFFKKTAQSVFGCGWALGNPLVRIAVK
jgi:hypothetical protein